MQGHSEQVTAVKWLSSRALEGGANFANGLEHSRDEWAFSSIEPGTSALNKAERCFSAFIIPGPMNEQHYAGKIRVRSEILHKKAGETPSRFMVIKAAFYSLLGLQ